MNTKASDEGISLFPFWHTAKAYSTEAFRHDLAAAITVALIALPQAMAYALIAHLPPAVGLYSAIFGTIFTAAFGSSRHLISGPTTAVAILIQAATAEILFTYYRDLPPEARGAIALDIVLQLTFLIGLIQILAGIFNLGQLIQFVSRSVIVGYVSGAALAIAINQLFYFFGIPNLDGVESLFSKIWYLASNLDLINWKTTIIGLFSLALLFGMKLLWKKAPAGVLMLLITSSIVYFIGWADVPSTPGTIIPKRGVEIVEDFGSLAGIYPHIKFPAFQLRHINALLPSAFAIALLGILEMTSNSRAVAARSGQKLSTNQEIFGLGMSNCLSGFLGAMPSSGSPSRTNINYDSGAQTRFSAVFSGVFLALIVIALGPFISLIPLTSLSSLLLITAYQMVNRREFLFCARATGADLFVLICTLVSCLLFSLDTAFYMGGVISISLYLRKAARPQFIECSYTKDGELRPLGPLWDRPNEEIRLIRVGGELFFGAADLFQSTLRTLADDDEVRVIILHLRNALHMDATAGLALRQLNSYVKLSGRHLLACGVTPNVNLVLQRSGIAKELGDQNIFLIDELDPHGSTVSAIHRAQRIIERGQTSQGSRPGGSLDRSKGQNSPS